MRRMLPALIACLALLVFAVPATAETDAPATPAKGEAVDEAVVEVDFEEMMFAVPLFEDDWDRPGLAGDLGLSEKQFEQVRAQRAAFEKERDRLVAAMRSEITCIRDCFKEKTMDREKLRSHTAKMRVLREELFERHTQYLIAVREIVSADQFQKMQRKHSGSGKSPVPWN